MSGALGLASPKLEPLVVSTQERQAAAQALTSAGAACLESACFNQFH